MQARREAWEDEYGAAPGLGTSLQASSSSFLPKGRVDGGSSGRVLPTLGLGSDSGKPQEVGEKRMYAPAGAGKTALTDEFHIDANSP
jgi:hypothetical protein